MTLKIVQGLVGTSSHLSRTTVSPAKDAQATAVQQAQSGKIPASEAVLTNLYSSVRRIGGSEGLPGFDKAKSLANDVARSIRERRSFEEHSGLEELGSRGTVVSILPD